MTWQKQLLNINGQKACDPALEWAAQHATFVDAYDACTDKDWIDWLVNALLAATATALKAYEEARDTAWKAYNEATAKAWKAYEEATAPARKAYDEAGDTAWKAYTSAIKPLVMAAWEKL